MDIAPGRGKAKKDISSGTVFDIAGIDSEDGPDSLHQGIYEVEPDNSESAAARGDGWKTRTLSGWIRIESV